MLLVAKVPVFDIESNNNDGLLSNVDFWYSFRIAPWWECGSHDDFIGPKYLWLDATNYWGIIIFAQFYNMFSDYYDRFMNSKKYVDLFCAAYNVLKIIWNIPRFLKIFEK